MVFRYSMFDAFLECPQKFYRQYVLNEPGEESSALHYGSAMHAALRAHFEDQDPLAVFNMYWGSIKGKDIKYDRFSWQDLSDITNNTFIPNFLRLHAKKFSNVKIEETLEMPFLGSHTLQGTFDLVGEYESVLTVVDWKTATREYKESKILRNPQLSLYAALYQYKYNTLPLQSMYKVFIKSEGRIQTQKCPLTQDSISATIANVEAIGRTIIHMMETKDYYGSFNCYCKEHYVRNQ